MDSKILQVAQAKMVAVFNLSPKELDKASALIDSVKPFKSPTQPDLFHVHSQSRSIVYAVNISTLDCQCEFGKNQMSKSFENKRHCAHINAAFLYRYYQVELERQQKEAELIDWRVALDAMAMRAGL